MLTAKDPLGHITRYHYDASFGNQDSVLAPGNRFSRIRFDQCGRDSASSGTSTPWRRKIYDVLNRLVQFYDGVNANPTTYGFDKLFLTRVQDPKGQVYRFAYNALGLVTQRFDPADTLNRYDSYRYDRDGLTVGWTNRRGQPLSLSYDALHRLTAKSGTNTVADSFAYSLEGRRVVSWNTVARDTMHSSPGNMWTDTTVTRIAGRRFQLLNFINNIGQLDSLTINSDTHIAFVTRTAWYNPKTQAIDSLGLNGAHIKFTVNADGRRTGVTLPTTPVVTLCRKTTTIHTVQDDTLSPGPLGANLTRRYGYDDLGRMWYDVNSAADKWIKFVYDGLSRLDSADYRSKFFGNNCSVDGDNGWLCDNLISSRDSLKTYSYDAVGNRTDNSGTYATGNRVLTFAGFTFEHDLDGNVTRKYGNGQDVRYYWSAEGLLDSVVAGTVRIGYAYDPRGQLVRKRVNGVDKRFFLWHGDHLVAELDSATQKRIGEYAYYPGVDKPMALVTGDTTPVLTRFFRQDQLGNVTSVISDSSVNQKVTYDLWGQQWITGTVADTNRLRWKGLLWEGDSTRLYYMRARWYDPSSGRFFSEDPMGIGAAINLYAFSGSNPVSGRDPSGLGAVPQGCYLSYGVEHWMQVGDGPVEHYIVWYYVCVGGNGYHEIEGSPSTTAGKAGRSSATAPYSNPVFVNGFNFSLVVGTGIEGGCGWYEGGAFGRYCRLSLAVGLAIGVGTETGGSRSVSALGGPGQTVCGSLFIVQGCHGENESGTTNTMGVTYGTGGYAATGYTWTWPVQPTTHQSRIDCAAAQPYNSVCNR